MSSFVGRRQEAHDLRILLSRARLVNVIGPGGVGKSRLAQLVATEIYRTFPDGAWLVELASLSHESLLAEAVAGALRVPERSGRDAVEALNAYLADRHLLLVLDNCEHVRDACAALLAAILPLAPNVHVLATSQEVLGLPGEAVYRLAPLAVPEEGEGTESAELSPAVALFADRAASALNGFSVTEVNVDAILELCHRLDGIPLAIELAAAHSRSLSPAQILARLDDRFQLLSTRSPGIPARHQSLKAAVEWSYELCTKPERLVWNRLSVFPASFDLPAAEAICSGDGLTRSEVTEAITELVDRSVLISESHDSGMRYRLLESIREYGRHMLLESADQDTSISEPVLRLRHLDWYVAMADEFDREWFGPGQHPWLERLHADLPNIRAALSYAAEHTHSTPAGLRLAGNLCFFWRVAALREGQSWLERLLHADSSPSLGRARALVALSWLLVYRAQPEGDALHSEALSITEALDPDRVARVLVIKGTLMSASEPQKALTGLEQAVARAQAVGRTEDLAYAGFGVGWSLGLAGAAAEAEAQFRESRAICETAGESWWRGVVSLRSSLVAWTQADLDLMTTAAEDALRAARSVPDLLTCADAMSIIGVSHVERDDVRAAYLFGAAERHWEDAGGSVVGTPPWGPLLEDAKNRCRTGLGSSGFDEQYRLGRENGLRDAMAIALGERTERKRQQPATHGFGLTRREQEIVALISSGLTNKEIAAKLVISTRTAETHVQNILMKTGFTSRSQIAVWHARSDS